MNLASLVEHNLREFGEYETTVFEGNWITNRGQAERSFRFANALRSLGVGPGDRVVVMLPNCPEVTQCYGAILRPDFLRPRRGALGRDRLGRPKLCRRTRGS